MGVPDAVVRLVERFGQQREDYRSGRYNETQLRRDFLDPLFAALGWDVHNEQGYAEPYREVIQRQMDATDQQIDRLVYELYDLADEEIRILEEATVS